jgi:hypothetical protein
MWGDFQNVSGGPPDFGHDTFVFGPHNGDDFIHDFHSLVGGIQEDIIQIDASKAPGNFPETFLDLNIQEVDTNGDNLLDSVIDLGGNNSVTVLGVIGLTASDFDFLI